MQNGGLVQGPVSQILELQVNTFNCNNSGWGMLKSGKNEGTSSFYNLSTLVDQDGLCPLISFLKCILTAPTQQTY